MVDEERHGIHIWIGPRIVRVRELEITIFKSGMIGSEDEDGIVSQGTVFKFLQKFLEIIIEIIKTIQQKVLAVSKFLVWRIKAHMGAVGVDAGEERFSSFCLLLHGFKQEFEGCFVCQAPIYPIRSLGIRHHLLKVHALKITGKLRIGRLGIDKGGGITLTGQDILQGNEAIGIVIIELVARIELPNQGPIGSKGMVV